MTDKKLNETASAGAIGAGSIAVNMGGGPDGNNQRKSFKEFLKNYNMKIVNNKGKFTPVKPFPISVNESFSLPDVLSRLTGMEAKATNNPKDFTTYGVEDDEGNIMKVTVPKDQSAEFEVYLAHKLGELETDTLSGIAAKSVSMAELLFNLKDKFTIVDVDFPKIPTDVVYNADKATTQPADDVGNAPVNNDMVGDNQVGGPNAAGDDLGLGPNAAGDMGAPGADMGGEDELPPVNSGSGPMDLNDIEGADEFAGNAEADMLGGSGGMGAPGGDGGDLGLGDDSEMGDAEGVEDFVDGPEDEGSILDKVIGLLKAQADAQKARADADAEKARAEQAEYSARAADATIAQEEEIAKMELDMDREKEADKQAKKLADIAKWRASRSAGSLNESEANESSLMVRRLINQLPQTWAISPDDDDQAKRYKSSMLISSRRELQARLQSARIREAEARRLKGEGRNPNTDRNVQQQQNMQGQQQGPQGQTAQ